MEESYINTLMNMDSDQRDELLAGMDNILKYESNLPINIWISQSFPGQRPVIFVQNNYKEKIDKLNYFLITIEDEPQIVGQTDIVENSDIAKVIKYIILNKKLLLKYWYHEIDSTIYVLNKLIKYEVIEC